MTARNRRLALATLLACSLTGCNGTLRERQPPPVVAGISQPPVASSVTPQQTLRQSDSSTVQAVDFESEIPSASPPSPATADTSVGNVQPVIVADPLAVAPAVSDGLQTAVTFDASSPPTLSLVDVEAMAMAHPAIAAADAAVREAQGRAYQACLSPNPTLQYQADEVGNEGSAGLHSVGVSQSIVTANKLALANQTLRQVVQQRVADRERTRLQVLTRVRTAYWSALAAQKQAELTDRIVDLAEQSLQSVQDLLDAEEVSKIALLQARVELENARIEAENAKVRADVARRALAAASGSDSIGSSRLDGTLGAGLTDRPWDRWLQTIDATSPELAAAGSELERARWALRLACAQVTPNITGQIGVGVDTGSDDTFARFGISVPLPIHNRNQGNIRAARAAITAAGASIDATRLDLASRLSQSITDYQTALQRYRRLSSQVLADAEETFELSRQAFQAGETNFLQLLTAQRTLFAARLNVLDAAKQAHVAAAAIDGLLVSVDSPN
ncbi:TolC family protein [Crateriforma spongiae]|uniref:TolC family protein n=1 Tax=Crateriforma spongiae TaxID=2724528 RepID=UPI0039B0723A